MSDEESVLNQREAAQYLKLDESTLWRYRRDKVGPPHIVLVLPGQGRKIVYKKAALDEWLAGNSVEVGSGNSGQP